MGLFQDLRFAVRLLIKDRWFTLVAVVTLALGIAANNAVFTFVNAVLIRGIPFKDGNRIVALGTRDTRNRNLGVSFLDFEDWRASARSFSDLCLFGQPTLNVSDAGRPPERYNGAVISANIFHLLDVRPLLGPGFTDEDDKFGAPPHVVLGYGVWQTRYGGRSDIIGQSVRIDELLATVVGVMPPGMQFPPNTDVWLPMGQSTIVRGQGRQVRSYQVIGRLANGVTPAQAQGELSAVVARLAHDFPKTNEGIVPTMVPYNERQNGSQIKIIFWTLMGAVAFVLLIACSNVANLLLAKAANRARELSVRISLGASRWRIVRQLLVESVLLALASGVVGFALSVLGIRWFDAVTQDVGKPYYMEFRLDAAVFAFFATVCLATGIVFGLAPALHVSKTNVNEVLKEGGRSGTGGTRAKRWTGALIVVNLTLTLVLLAAAGFMMRSFLAMYRMDPGVDTSRLLTMQMALSIRKYPNSSARNAFFKRVDERLAAISAIDSATTATNWPLGGGRGIQLAIDGRTTPGERLPIVTLLSVGAKYLDTLGIHVTRGRAFTEADWAPGAAPAIVNQRLVDMYFKAEDPARQGHSVERRGAHQHLRRRAAGADDRRRDESQCDPARRRRPLLGARSSGVHPARRQCTAERRRHAADPNAKRSGTGDGACPRGAAGAGSRHAALQHPDDGRESHATAVAVSRVRHDVRRLCRHRAGAVGRGSVRHHGVWRDAADAGDRRPHGAWRRGASGVVADRAARPDSSRHRDAHWDTGRSCRRPPAPEPARADNSVGSDDPRRNRDAADRRRGRGVLLARAARHPAGSGRRAAT